MKLQFMFNYLNNKFINSSIKTKIELYIFPLLLLYLIFFIFQSTENELPKIETKISINEYSNQEFRDSFFDLFSDIETYASKNQIKILSINNNKKIITIKAKAQLKNIEKLIRKIENINNFTNIKSFTLSKDDLENYKFEIQIDLSKFFIKKIEEEIDIPLENEEFLNNQKNNDFKINGIILNYAFINDTWVTINDVINEYKIIKIGKDFVLLRNEDSEIKLEIIDENSNKNFN